MRKVKYSFKQWCKDNGHKDWLLLWDYELNDVGPDNISYSSHKHCWFKCSNGIHDSEHRLIYNLTSCRNSSIFCKKCNSFGQYLINNYGAHGIELYWSDKNTVDPFSIMMKSNRKIFIKCINGNTHPDYQTTPHEFTYGYRCPVCINHKVINGINDIATTHPWLVEYFVEKSEATKYTVHSKHKTWFQCPFCGYKRYGSIQSVIGRNNEFVCQICSDGKSFPNKFIAELLSQLESKNDIIFKSEKVFDWSKNLTDDGSYRQYDFHIIYNNENIIIEAHGAQHYGKQILPSHSVRTFEEEVKNDKFKYELAIQNGIKQDNYVVVDCRESTKEWISYNIMNSNLPQLLNFTYEDIDWDKCYEIAKSSLFRKCCTMWENKNSIKEISQQTALSESCVCKYLREAENIGVIEYNSRIRKPVLCLENSLVFSNANVCENISDDIFGEHIRAGSIRSAANGCTASTHGFHFLYISKNEFIQIKDSESWRVYE